ncbi:MAG TPA: glycosyltransferase family 4 protein [Pyrinomonadaceae bacterium]|nr:glycosyltransferase family 4 protein [Pyrinomonadaceae bacterium]
MIPYLRELVKGGHDLTLLTFEPGEVDEKAMRDSLAADSIEWEWLRYHKRPSVPATLYDIANGVRMAVKIARRKKIDIFHVRGHIPAPIGAIAKRICGGKLLFDIRGFLPEEYVDAGIWDEKGTVYKAFKRVERWAMKKADGFVVLTEAARDILFSDRVSDDTTADGRPFEVIPCCVDFSSHRSDGSDSWRQDIRKSLNLEDRKVIVYVGSLGGWYLTDEMFDFLECFLGEYPEMHAMILTQRDQNKVISQLKARGFVEDQFTVKGVPPSEVAKYLAAADVSISFIKNCYSKKSSSPTKIAEYLAAGLPIISNSGIGDLDEVITSNQVGALVRDFSSESYREAIRAVSALTEVRSRCVAVANREFDLTNVGGAKYRRLYKRLVS